MLSDRYDMTLVRYNTVASLVMALRYGQVDVIATERPSAIEIMNCMSGLRIVEPATATDQLVACVNIDRTDVLGDFNAFASGFYGSEAYIELYDRLNGDSFEYHEVEQAGGEKILNVGIATDCYPFCYIDSESGEIPGSDPSGGRIARPCRNGESPLSYAESTVRRAETACGDRTRTCHETRGHAVR